MIDSYWELRFFNAKYNYLFVMLLAIALPVSTFLWALFRESKSITILGIITSLCLIFPCLFTFTFAQLSYFDIKADGVDYSFEEINRLNVDNKNYILYRTNGGATTAFGLVLRLEKEIGLSIKAVHVLYSKYEAYESSLELINDHQIKMEIQPYDNGKVEVVVLNI